MPDATNPREIEVPATVDFAERLRANPELLITRLLTAECQCFGGEKAQACRSCTYCVERRVAADTIEALLEQRKRMLDLCDTTEQANAGEAALNDRLWLDEIRAIYGAALEEPCK